LTRVSTFTLWKTDDEDGFDSVKAMDARKDEVEGARAQQEARRRTALDIASTTDAQA
jgi:hypothetical protein